MVLYIQQRRISENKTGYKFQSWIQYILHNTIKSELACKESNL